MEMETLPTDIFMDILSRLPVESLSPSTRVCKTWRHLLGSAEFADRHLRRQLQQQQQQQQQFDHGLYYYHDDGDNLYRKASSSNNCGVGVDSGGGTVSFLFLARTRMYHKKSGNISIYYGEYNDDDEGYLYYKKLTEKRIYRGLPSPTQHLNASAIVGSCNGLICFTVSHNLANVLHDPVNILNPITGQEVNLPNFVSDINIRTRDYHYVEMASGFGYLRSTNEYKVVRISYLYGRKVCDWEEEYDSEVGQVEVYTLCGGIDSGRGWRNKGEISSNILGYESDTPSTGVLVDEALHWLDFTNLRIVVFDLASKELLDIPLPPCFKHKESAFYHLRVLGGCLCIVHVEQGKQVDIWSLKMKENSCSNGRKEQAHEWSWSWEFNIAWEGKHSVKYEPIALTKSGELLLFYDQSLSLYEPKTATLKILEYGNLCLEVFQAIPHLNSFISLSNMKERLEENGRMKATDLFDVSVSCAKIFMF